MSRSLTHFYLGREEIDTLACAVARSVDPQTKVTNAWDAATVVWTHRDQAGPVLCSLATAFAEATPPPPRSL